VVYSKGGRCTPVHIRVSGTDFHFEGTAAFYESYNHICGAFLDRERIILDLASDGASVEESWPPEVAKSCDNCEQQTWVRVTER
jgi:hypothetical protein